MSLYDLITGRKCCAKLHSFPWVSVIYPVESHDFLLFERLWLVNAGHMTWFKCHCSFQLECLHQVVLIVSNQDYSLMLLFKFLFLGSGCPNFCKNGSARGVNYPKLGVLRGVPSVGSNSETRIILVKNTGCLLLNLQFHLDQMTHGAGIYWIWILSVSHNYMT